MSGLLLKPVGNFPVGNFQKVASCYRAARSGEKFWQRDRAKEFKQERDQAKKQ